MLKYTVKKYCSEGSKVHQVVMVLLMVLPVFSYGMAIGWLSPMGPKLMSEDTPAAEPVHSDIISWMASVPYLVGTAAVFIYGFIVDSFGRKKALMMTSFCMAACWSLKIYSTSNWALILARAIVGFGVGGSYVVTPLYIKEVSEDSIRGTLGTFVVLSQNLGNLLVYIAGEYLCYTTTLWICLAVPLIHLLIFITMPETPSYLLKCGKVEEARSALAWLRCRQLTDTAVDNELQSLLLEMEQNSSSQRFFEVMKILISDPSTFRAFRIILTITVARELCGCLAVLHFASLIFDEANGGWVLSANQQAALLGVVQLIGSLTASSLVERTGRKPLLGATCLVSGLSLVALSAWFYLRSGGAAVPVAALCLCIYCDAAGLQPVPFVMMTEMFSFQFRGTVTSIVIAFACGMVSIELRAFQPLASSVGLQTVFGIFAAVCLVSTAYIALWVPETRMRTIEGIYAELRGKDSKETTDNGKKDCEGVVTRL